ncbi:MAG: AAA family ATPase, partial [bacterium]|nr:AAA family ATPase [bacterium]
MEEIERFLEIRENSIPESLLIYLTGIIKQQNSENIQNNKDDYLWYIDKIYTLYNKLSTKEDRKRFISKIDRFVSKTRGEVPVRVNKFKVYMIFLYIFGYIDRDTLSRTTEQARVMSMSSGFYTNKSSIFKNVIYNIPFGILAKDPDIDTFSERLEKYLYSTDDVKERICQSIAFNRYTKQYKPRPLLFIGPPGTGKTKMAKTIALALNRKAEIINLAGRMDVAFLYG